MEIPIWLLFTIIADLRYGYSKSANPILYWPLGDVSATCKATGNADLNYPNDTIYVASGHPNMGYRALSLDGSSRYISLVLPKGPVFQTFAFIFYVYPESDTGTLLHFKSDSPESGKVSQVLLRVVSSVVYIEFWEGANKLFFNTSAHSLVMNQWTYVAVRRLFNKGKIEMFTDTGQSTEASKNDGHKNKLVLGNPGRITLGMRQPTGDFLKGRFTCLAVFITDVFKDDMFEPFVCNNLGHWACGSVTVIEEGVKTVVARKVWPLTNYSHGYDLTKTAPLYPLYPECSRYSPGYTGIQGQAMLFDGYWQSFEKLQLDVELIVQSFTLTFFINPSYYSRGTILNYIYSENSSIQWEIQLRTSDRDLELEIWILSVLCDRVYVTDALVPNNWQYVAIEKKEATFSLFINNDTFQGLGVCAAPTGLSGAGDLFVGNNAANDDSFRGSLLCLILFDGELSDGHKSVADSCNSTFIPADLDVMTCTTKAALRDSYYKMSSRNASPHPLSESPVKTSLSSSLSRCGKSCTGETYCRSFSLSHDKTCKLFDFVAKSNEMLSDTGTNYYLLQSSGTG